MRGRRRDRLARTDRAANSHAHGGAHLASISCGPDNLAFEFTLFASATDIAAAYEHDLGLGETPAEPDGTCADANFEGTYSVGDRVVGRVNCRQHTSSSSGSVYHVIEWTDDQLLVLGYISNRADLHTWEELIAFWSDQAGPFAP